MKKNILQIFLALLMFNFSFAQTTATDFTTNDCDGVSHHLFEELNNGDVIVICWVMPCGPCAPYAEYASDAVQSFASSHPGRVKYYLADDYANSACSTIVGWATNYNIVTNASFSSSALDMHHYGQSGMPKVVVLGGVDHSIYYNQNDIDIAQAGVENAIALALSETTLNVNELQNFSLSLFPNPTDGLLNISFDLYEQKNIKFEVINMLGKAVISHEVVRGVGNHLIPLTVGELDDGYYFLRFITDNKIETKQFVITY